MTAYVVKVEQHCDRGGRIKIREVGRVSISLGGTKPEDNEETCRVKVYKGRGAGTFERTMRADRRYRRALLSPKGGKLDYATCAYLLKILMVDLLYRDPVNIAKTGKKLLRRLGMGG